jgi:hypothetical protein
MIDTYIEKIASITKRGDAREESYYPALAALLEEFSETKRKKKAHVTVLPKKTEAGNPDFRVWDAKHSQVGYVEAKPPRANLDEIETSDQLKRYISLFPNLILVFEQKFSAYSWDSAKPRVRVIVKQSQGCSYLKRKGANSEHKRYT